MKIQSTQDVGVGDLKAIVYGPSGNGKTTLLASSGEPGFIISAEAGLLSLKKAKEIYGDWVVLPDFVDLAKDDDGNQVPENQRIFGLEKAYKYLLTKEAQEKYKWVFLDSLTEISQLLVSALKEKYPEKKNAMNLWGDYADEMRSIIKKFRDLPGYNVVITALSKEAKDDEGQILTLPDVAGKISNQIPAYFDLVLFYHKAKSDDGYIRKLLTDSTDTIRAKDRSGALDRLENPSLREIASKIRSTK